MDKRAAKREYKEAKIAAGVAPTRHIDTANTIAGSCA